MKKQTSQPKARAGRTLPRPFTMHWGSGQIVEEATYVAEHHEPSIQLLEYDDPVNTGSLAIRFCFYSHDGRFQRSPLMAGPEELDGLRAALATTPRLRAMLRRLVR